MPSLAVPAFPGAIYKSLICELFAIFHAKACSLPPDPYIKTFFFDDFSQKYKRLNLNFKQKKDSRIKLFTYCE